ncbi:MAG: UDP-N-acetylmuramate--L-alanine ligase, partial [Cloacibacillus sp.]
LPIYGSDERPIEGVSSKLIFDAASDDMRSHYELSGNFDDLITSVCQAARSGDIILTVGAGSIGTLGNKIVDKLTEMQK